jgi:hypothetical protein
VGEMKERIIDMLKVFSSEDYLKQPHPMFNAICEELPISPKDLHQKSKQLLKHIMHNYDTSYVGLTSSITILYVIIG